MMQDAWGIGLRRAREGRTLDVYFPFLGWRDDVGGLKERLGVSVSSGVTELGRHVADPAGVKKELVALLESREGGGPGADALDALLERIGSEKGYCEHQLVWVETPDSSAEVAGAEDAYLRLHLISSRLVKPHGLSFDGIFKYLQNVAWTNHGPVLPKDLDRERMRHWGTAAPLQVTHVDKFPYLVNYTVPEGVRIADGARVRLGAYLGKGTTVMPAGFVNFNAGTEGRAMIEGRVSAGVFVGDESDVGGGASIMGTLSGGNKTVIRIGRRCLLGANAGAGISLGDGCTIAAGTYVTGGSKVYLYDQAGKPVDLEGKPAEEGQNRFKARELSGRENLLFLLDTGTGRLVCRPNPRMIELNEALHQHD